jgi:hypothetical protein
VSSTLEYGQKTCRLRGARVSGLREHHKHPFEPKGAETIIYLNSQGVSLHSRYSALCTIANSIGDSPRRPWPYRGHTSEVCTPQHVHIYSNSLPSFTCLHLRGKRHGGKDCEVSLKTLLVCRVRNPCTRTSLSHAIFLTRGS